MKTPRQLCASACTLLMLTLVVGEVSAQRDPFTSPRSPDGRVPVTLVLVSNGLSPAIMRRAGAEPRNVIVLDAGSASARQLSDALFGLMIMEAHDPNGSKRSDNELSRFRLSKSRPVVSWSSEALIRLQAATTTRIRGVGAGRVLEVWVKPLPAPAP